MTPKKRTDGDGSAAPEAGTGGQGVACGCYRCLEQRGERIWWMVLCARCGNKRCPQAADHELDCTASNDVGQPGSAYEHGSGAATARRMASGLTPPASGASA